MDAVAQWLENGALYDEGVLLYETLPSHNKLLLKNFKRKSTPQLQEKLKYELKKFAKAVTSNSVNTTSSSVVIVTEKKESIINFIEVNYENEEKHQAIFFHDLPTELRPFLLQANTLFKEMCFLKVQLNDLPPLAESKALEIQLKISKKQKENSNCWKKIDYWKEHKVAPKLSNSKAEKLTPAQLVKREQLLFASISKLNARLKSNKEKLASTNSLNESNKLHRAISKQENNLLIKNDELLNIKRLINE